MQKSTLNGSHGISIVEVIVGKDVGDKNVFVGIASVLIITGCLVTSIFAQDARKNKKIKFNKHFIKLSCLCEQRSCDEAISTSTDKISR